MPINANLKAQVQARINAAGNGSTLEELWNLKLIARGLDCNETNINNLIELRLNEFGASTELKSLLQGALSVRPYALNILPKRKTFTLSETWVAPAKIVPDSLVVTGCAGAGSGAIGRYWSSDPHYLSGGQRGEFIEKRPVAAVAGQSFSVIVGSGGPASTQAYGENNAGFKDGNTGGNSSFGSLILRGGRGGRANNSLLTVAENMATAAGPRIVAQTQFLGANDWRVWASLQAGVATPYAHGAFYVDWFNSTEGALLKKFIGGGDAGLFGAGSDFSSNQSTGNAPAANTGAGSGAAFYGYSGGWSLTLSSAPGSAGRWEAEWLEYE